MPTTLFLSYARGDDEAFVARLYAHLTAQEFDVWWEGAMTKLECRMSNETNGCARFTSSFGIRHSTFAYVIAEWQHAVTFGKAINPIRRLGDFPLVPDEMKLLHIEDFRDHAHSG